MAIDQNLIQGAAAANRAKIPMAAQAITKATKTITEGATGVMEAVTEYKKEGASEFDKAMAKLESMDGLDSDSFANVADEIKAERSEYIKANKQERSQKMIELNKKAEKIADANVFVQNAPDKINNLSKAVSEKEKTLYTKALTEPVSFNDEGQLVFTVDGEQKTQADIQKIIDDNQVDPGVSVVRNTANKYVDFGAQDKNAPKPVSTFNLQQARTTAANIVNDSKNLKSLAKDPFVAEGKSFEDHMKEAIGKDINRFTAFDKNNDDIFSEGELKDALEAIINNDEYKGILKSELTEYFAMLFKQNYESAFGDKAQADIDAEEGIEDITEQVK